MPLTLDDLMKFMQDEKAERAHERERDKQEIKEMISNGVKKEIEAVLAPVQEKQQLMEKTQDHLKVQFLNVLQEVKDLKEQLNKQQTFPLLQEPSSASSLTPSGTPRFACLEKIIDKNLSRVVSAEERQIRTLASEARKILGLHRINMEDVERAGRLTGALDEDDAYIAAVKEFFRLEMKIGESVYDTLNIKQIFPPAKDNWDTLYVRFESEASVNTIYTYAKNLKKENRLVRYIPKQFYDRYRAMESEAYLLRHSAEKFKTRVKMGVTNLILYKKKPSERTWSIVPDSTDWPNVTLTLEDASNRRTSGSPPPGRPPLSSTAPNPQMNGSDPGNSSTPNALFNVSPSTPSKTIPDLTALVSRCTK